MMPVSTAITHGIAAVSLVLAGVSVTSTVKKVTSPAAIEGSGVYTSPVRAGETVSIEWIIVKRTDCAGSLGRVWAGEGGFYLVEPLRPSGLPSSDTAKQYSIQTMVPALAPVGRLDLSIKGVYNCPDGDISFALGPVDLEVIE